MSASPSAREWPPAVGEAPGVVTPNNSVSWQDQLLRGRARKNADKGPVLAVLANAITALRLAPEWAGVLAFNEFSLGTVALNPAPWGGDPTGGEWTDHEDRLTADWLQHVGVFVSVEVAGQAVQTVAKDRAFHPVREYLESLQWDGNKRIDAWLSLYLGAEPTDYMAAVGARWLVSAVARIYQPGAKADCCLILEGVQGLKKSTALKSIAGDWFTDEIADLGSKDAAMRIPCACAVSGRRGAGRRARRARGIASRNRRNHPLGKGRRGGCCLSLSGC